jgi:hypothetical protein
MRSSTGAVSTKSNAMKFFNETNYYIHQGNKDRLQAISEELRYSIGNIFKLASKLTSGSRSAPNDQACAHNLLLTIADRRFCNLVVERNPALALQCFVLAETYRAAPFTQFARNVGEEFIVNLGSAFYQEDSGYNSGYFGYSKPITSIIFGSYELIERCALQHSSPLDLRYSVVCNLDSTQVEGFTRAGLSFFDTYLDKNRSMTHSYALARLLGSLKSCASGLYKLNDLSADPSSSPEYARFKAVADFLRRAIEKLAKSGVKARSLRPTDEVYHDVYDALAHTIVELIFEAATVNVDSFLCWDIQHNTAWTILFSSFNKDYTFDVLRFKVRRLIYNEITHNSTNFLGARYLGFCLNVCGLTKGDRYQKLARDSFALRVCVIKWTRKNYRHLLAEHPNVARGCLQGSVTYDPDKHQLVKTFSDATRNEPPREVLVLD